MITSMIKELMSIKAAAASQGGYIASYCRGIGRGGLKGSDKPPFKPGFILKVANYLAK